jgi:hypothetical protein
MTNPGEEHERGTVGGETGAPLKPRGEHSGPPDTHERAEAEAHGGGLDIGDVAEEVAADESPDEAEPDPLD